MGETRYSVLLDMDGVLVDFIGGIVKRFGLGSSTNDYISRTFGTKKKCPWNLEKLFPSLSLDDLYDVFTVDFWAHLEPTAWFEWLIVGCRPEPGVDVYLCTSPGYLGGEHSDYFRNAVIGKELWIMKHLPEMCKNVIFTFDKRPLACGNVLVDDSDENVVAFDRAILCPAPWNSNYRIYWQGEIAVCAYILDKLGAIAEVKR